MVSFIDNRPTVEEHAPWAAKYIEATTHALAHAPRSTIHDVMNCQLTALHALVDAMSHADARRPYAPGKWTLLESLLHVADTERVFAYRVLRIARADETPLPGFDQDTWVPYSGANDRTLGDILTELKAVRGATLALLRTLDDAAVARTGTTNGNTMSVRALVWMITGHFEHHLEITRTRYLSTAD